MKSLTKILLVLFLFTINNCAQEKNENEISIEELTAAQKSDSNLVILDVRNPHELTSELGSIDGVLNIPMQEIENRIEELNTYKDKNIAVVCRSGRRSGIITNVLVKNGFKAKNIVGGMIAYNKFNKSKEKE